MLTLNGNLLMVLLFLLAFIPSNPTSSLKTFFVPLCFIILAFALKKVSKVLILLFFCNISIVLVSSLFGDSEFIPFLKEIFRANLFAIFLFFVGSFKELSVSKLVSLLYFIFILNFFMLFFQMYEVGLSTLYTQKNADSLFFRSSGLLGNPNLTAFFISIFLLFFSFEPKFSNRFLVVVLSLFSAFLLQSRSGFLLIFLSSSYVLFFSLKFGGSFLFRVIIIFLLILFISLSCFVVATNLDYLFTKFPYLMSAFSTDITQVSSLLTRYELWGNALELTSNPYFGGAILYNTLVVDSEYVYTFTHRGGAGICLTLTLIFYSFFVTPSNRRNLLTMFYLLVFLCSFQAETFSSSIHMTIIGLFIILVNAIRNKITH